MMATERGRYELQRSRDLQSWKPVAAIQMTEPGPLEFTHTDPAADRMFYRIALDPSGQPD